MPVTRQLRLTELNGIRRQLPRFVGKKINLVLRDSRVLYGELVATWEEGITLRNMRRRRLEVPYSSVSEAFFDSTAPC